MTEFRVSTNRTGEKRWWLAHEEIPSTHTAVRPATEDEAKLMRRILACRSLPPASLGDRVCKLMEQTP